MSNAQNYHDSNKLQVTVTKILLESVKDLLARKNFIESKLIDIGTGDGRVLVEVFIKYSAIKFSKVVGTDKREDVIKFANKNYGSDLINFQTLDMEDGSKEIIQKFIEDGQFDLATSFFALHYSRDNEKVFSNIRELLKPGGSFYFNFIDDTIILDIFEMLIEKYPQIKSSLMKKIPVISKDSKNLPQVIEKCGFTIDFLNFEPHSFDFESERQFRDTITSSIPFLYEMEEEFRTHFLNDFVEINQKMSEKSGKKEFEFPHVFVHGLITKKPIF